MKIDRNETKKEAMEVLAEMNAMIRGQSFAKMVNDRDYERLNARIQGLGWLALLKSLKIVQTAKGQEMHVQLKLVSPDSKEARDL